MGTIKTAFETAYRDFTTAGVASSGLYEPAKAVLRELGKIIEDSTTLLAGGFAEFENAAALPAEGPAEGEPRVVFVLNDPVPANNGVRVWRNDDWEAFTEFYDAMAAVVQPLVDAAAGSADAAAASAEAVPENGAIVSLYPDPYFSVVGPSPLELLGGHKAVSGQYINRTWDADYVHAYGKGAWLYDSDDAGLMGFELWYDLAGLVEGDTFSIAMLVTAEEGAEGDALLQYRQFVMSTPVYNFGANPVGGFTSAAMDGSIKVLKLENIAVVAGAAGTVFYAFDADPPIDFRVLAAWVVRGATIGNRPPPRVPELARQRMVELDTSAAYGEQFAKADWATVYGPIWGAAEIVEPDLAAPGQTARTNNFSGFGDVVLPPAGPMNALQVTINQATGGAAGGVAEPRPWVKIEAIVRTGAAGTAHTVGGTLLALGSIDVDPTKAAYADLTIPLRDPDTDALLVDGIDALDYGDEIFRGVWGVDADGNRASLNQFNGTRSDRVVPPRSYYVTVAGDPLGAGWADLTGDAAIGIRHLMLSDLADGYQPSPALKEQMEVGVDPTARLAVALSAYGVPRGAMWRPELLVNWHQWRARRLAGADEQFDIAIFGDSWTDSDKRYVRMVTEELVEELGDAGPGWISLGFNGATVMGNARANLYSVVKAGTWTSDYGTAPTPNISNAKSSEVGAKYTITALPGATAVLSSMRMLWTGTADGEVRYRWDGGTWTNLLVQGDGFQSALLDDLPALAVWTLEVEVVGGSVNLQGFDGRSAAAGVRVHKFSNSGSSAARWTAVNEAQFVAAITPFAFDMAILCLSTNDRAAGTAPNSFYTAMSELVSRFRAASPACDLLLMAPCENERADAFPTVDYTNQSGRLADEAGGALLDLQYVFGMDVNVYKLGGTRPWFVDLVHPVDADVMPGIPIALLRVLRW